jgi:integrase
MVYKRGDTYWYEFRHKGERVRESTHQENRQAAIAIESARRTQLNKGEVGLVEKPPVPTVAEFSEVFKEQMKSEHAAKPKTLSYYLNSVRGLGLYRPLQKAKLDQVEKIVDDFVAFRRACKKRGGKTINIASVNRELETLRRLLYVAQKRGIIDRVPRIKRRKGEVGRERILDHAEEAAYLNCAKPLLRDIATLIADTGLRPEEAFRVTWPNVHFQPAGKAAFGRIFNPYGKSKFAKRNVSMTSRVRALLQMRYEIQGKPQGWVFPAKTKTGHVNEVKSQHKRALKDSGLTIPQGSPLEPIVLYSLRHTFLTRLGEAGVSAFEIQKIAGHSSILMSQRYVHPTPEGLENAFVKLAEYNARKEAELQQEQEHGRVQ